MKNKEEILSKIDLLIQAIRSGKTLGQEEVIIEELKEIGDFINENL